MAERVTEMLKPMPRRVYGILRETIVSYGEDECALRAAALAYHALLSFFPLLLFIIFLASQFIQAGGTREALIAYIARAVPQFADTAKDLIETTIDASTSFGLIGAAGLLWSASAMFTVLSSTFNVIWEAKPRPLWRRRLIGLIAVLAIAILFVFSLLARTLTAFDLATYTPLSRRWINLGADLGVTMLLTWILYTLLPNKQVRWIAALGGAALAALLWQVAKSAFSIYLTVALERMDAIYGSLGSVVVLVLWVYFSSAILFVGAEFAAALQQER